MRHIDIEEAKRRIAEQIEERAATQSETQTKDDPAPEPSTGPRELTATEMVDSIISRPSTEPEAIYRRERGEELSSEDIVSIALPPRGPRDMRSRRLVDPERRDR